MLRKKQNIYSESDLKEAKNIYFRYGGNKFEYCEIDSNSYRTAGGNRYLSFIINLKYENQENQLQLRVYFANMTSTNPEIIYASAE